MAAPLDAHAAVPRHAGDWTVADVLALPEDDGIRTELVDGALLMSPAPAARHQRILGRLYAGLLAAAAPDTEVLLGVNVQLSEQRLLIPDLAVVTCPGADVVHYYRTDLVLAGEIESPSNKLTDRIIKRKLYADAEIPYYLLVDPKTSTAATLFELSEGSYQEIARSENGRFVMHRPFLAEIDL